MTTADAVSAAPYLLRTRDCSLRRLFPAEALFLPLITVLTAVSSSVAVAAWLLQQDDH